MEWRLANKHLVEIYTEGGSKKFSFMNKKLCEKFVERIERIAAAETIFDLRDPPSMQFEALKGTKNRFSIRLDRKHRLEFEIDFIDDSRTYGCVTVITVSKHYQ